MKVSEISKHPGWAITVCFWACVIQWMAEKIISFLMGKLLLTNERIEAMTAGSGPISSLPIMQKLTDFEQKFFIFLRTDIFAGLFLAFIFFALLTNKKVGVAFWTIFSICFLGLFGVGYFMNGDNILLFLALCVPICAYGLVTREKSPESYDFHDMGGRYHRGAKLVYGGSSATAFAQLSKEDGKPGINLFPNKPFPFRRENEHILLTGSPGSGKTQMIYSWLEEVYKRGDKAIVWDVKGTFIQSFIGQKGVDLLAAWDQRSMVWSPGEDIKNHLDCQQMAEIIIPRNPREIQQHFPDSARQVLEAVLIYLDARGRAWGWADLWEIVSSGRKELSKLLASFPEGRGAASLIEGDSGRSSADDVYSTLMAHTQKTIRWFAKAWPAKGGQSIRKWVHGDSKFLILGGIPERAELANATANIAINLIATEILSMEDDPNRRIWLFLDELATLGRIEAVLQAFLLGRSKGLCAVAGIQDMGKIEHHYNPMLAKSISNIFGTKIFLRCSDVGTSQWASKVLGEQDIYERQVSEGESSEGMFSKKIKTKTEQDVLRTRVMFTSTEIANFNNLEGVLQVSGWPLIRFWWRYQPIEQKVKLYEPASWVNQKASLSDPGSSGKSDGKQWRLDA